MDEVNRTRTLLTQNNIPATLVKEVPPLRRRLDVHPCFGFYRRRRFFAECLGRRPRGVEGHDYARIKTPQPVATGNKVEVLEFFWYRCPHCFQLEPGLDKWLKTLPKDTQVRRVPAVFRDDWSARRQAYYTLEQMGLLSRLHAKVFDAYHLETSTSTTPPCWAVGSPSKGGPQEV